MDYPLQDFELDEETDFLLGGASQHGTMDGDTARNRTPRKRRKLVTFLCRWVLNLYITSSG